MAIAVADTALRRLPPALLAGALVIAALLLHAVVPAAVAPAGGGWPLVGAAVAAAGAAWALWAVGTLHAAGTPLAGDAEPRVLVEEGPYRFGRHPFYLGVTAAQLGLALALGVPALAAGAAVFAAVVQRVHIPHEESRLRRRFGGWYSDYAAQVRRWL